MKNALKYALCLTALAVFIILIRQSLSHEATREREEAAEMLGKVAGRYEQEFLMTRDPATNTVPRLRLLKAMSVANKRRALMASKDVAIPVFWQERGPNNVGGRTRGLLIDANDASGRSVWAGGVAGGLWHTTNIDASPVVWNNIDDFFENLAISTIAQDPSNTNILYFGTGEGGFGNADGVRGLGIWRSMDGGANWAQLPSTTGFTVVNKMLVDNAGTVYAATNVGIRRSTDNGNTWAFFPGAPAGNIQDLEIAANGVIYAASGGTGVFRFQGGAWGMLAGGLPASGFGRIEVACAPGDANVLYAAFEDVTQTDNTNPCLAILRSPDGGNTWAAQTVPNLGDFCWYALIMAVDPNNSNHIWAGDQSLFASTDGGANWTGIGGVHADHHAIVYRPGNSNEIVFGNDGGVYRCTNGSNANPTLTQKNNSYNVTQFYANALHPTAGSNYILGGTQDNGTQRFNSPGLGSTDEPTGADGAFCFIDQDNANIQITGSQNRHFNISTNGGVSWGTLIGSRTGVLFITPAEYDNANNIFYFSDGRDTLGRITGIGGGTTTTFERITAFNNSRISSIAVSPNTNNRLFVGTTSGRFVRIDNANNAGSVTATALTSPVGGFISSIVVEDGDDNHLIVTCSNFGLNSVLESTDGGTTWIDLDNDLPDMPVRCAMFHPFDNDKLLLCTELGVWSTDDLDGVNTKWWPTSDFGLANVRCDMFQHRASDHLVAVATHGRGMYSTDYFTLLTTCPPNMFIGGAIMPGIYMAEDFITSDGKIDAGRKVIFQAGTSISLIPGFHAEAGSDFWALILECGFAPVVQPKIAESDGRSAPPEAPTATNRMGLHCQPNPVTYQLSIEFKLPSEGNYTLYVRDLQGRLVQTIEAAQNAAAGPYQHTLDASSLGPGLYVLTLQTAKEAVTERFIVAK